MQITDLKQEQKIMPLFRLGFRPFFLGGAVFSVIAIILWGMFLHGSLSFTPLGGNYWWHLHEMIFGFAAAIITGFLLTAVQNWTGSRGVSGNKLMVLFAIWLIARIGILFPALLGEQLTTIVDIAFLPIVAYFLGKPIIAIKQYRNLFFIPLLLLFTFTNIEMHYAIYLPDLFSVKYTGYAAVMLITFLMSVMSGRVTPMFTANGTGTQKVLPIKWLDIITNGSVAVALFALLLQPYVEINALFMTVVFAIAGISQAIRWFRWKPWITLGVPLLWSLHFAVLFVWFGLLMLALAFYMPELPMNHFWHLITIGGMAGLILAMISRVTLGHTGRPLMPPKIMSVAFAFVSLSALTRAFGPWFIPEKLMVFVDISITFWVIAFAVFAWKYGPMLLSERADKRPG
jgi:uncharacterized protein involved in response to NO